MFWHAEHLYYPVKGETKHINIKPTLKNLPVTLNDFLRMMAKGIFFSQNFFLKTIADVNKRMQNQGTPCLWENAC